MRSHRRAPIRVRTNATGQPEAFTHQGRSHRVERICEVSQPCTDWWLPEGELRRTYYLIVTHLGWICEIYQDERSQDWSLARVYD